MDKGTYQILECKHNRLAEYGFHVGSIVEVLLELNGVVVFYVYNSKIGVRKSDLSSLVMVKIERHI